VAEARDGIDPGRTMPRSAPRGASWTSAFFQRPAPPDPMLGFAPDAPDAPQHFAYCAFLSYGHRDAESARWLHEALEKYRVPPALVGRVTANGAIPARLFPIFRDRHELAAAGDLGREIRDALAGSRFLIVLCSPAAAVSKWTGAEIDSFKKMRPDGCILAAIIAGEPFASDIAGREAEECFPAALRHKYDKRGRATKQRAEPIAADFRAEGDGRRLGFLKIVAGMLGVGLDDLVQRDTVRRQKRLRLIAAASLAGMVVTSGLSVMAFQARNEAREQRREAEGLVGFMLGDLRKKLEPLGRLDTLDAVGSRALAYYEKQDKSALSDAALAQRARALTLMGQIAQTRGDLDGALPRYREALASTSEQLRRDPDNPQRLFDQAQNVFWVGYIAWQRGHAEQGAAAFREYKRLALRMIGLAPDEPKYRLEASYADSNLGTVLMEQRRFPQAAAAFRSSLVVNEALLAGDPNNREYAESMLETLAWLADALENSGRIEEAIGQRERELALAARQPDSAAVRLSTFVAHRAMGRMLASRDQLAAGIAEDRTATRLADALIATEPGNSQWLEYAANGQFEYGGLLLLGGQRDAAASAVRTGCDLTERLIAKNKSVVAWNDGLSRDCALARARLAWSGGSLGEAQALAQQAARPAPTGAVAKLDAQATTAVARTLLGDISAARGDRAEARRQWSAALALLAPAAAASPKVLSQRAILLRRMGDEPAAQAIATRLDAIGYRHPDYVKAFNQGAKT
jgi:eukaryotic-like serine/threonine-protein kinase